MLGSADFGHKCLGEKNNTAGSNFIINLIDEKDKRPIWFILWGGGNTLAQAIWKVNNERSTKEVNKFLNKIRIYAITDQDVVGSDKSDYNSSSHYWIRHKFGEKVFFIWDESAWKSQNSIGSKNWKEYATHIQKHGNLGNIYPKNKYGVEGDTPSFLHILPNGLNNPESPNQIGWGGYFQWELSLDNETYCYTNSNSIAMKISQKYENLFYPAIFNNFAARMDWASQGKGNRNPIVIINKDKSLKPLHINQRSESELILDASDSYDPDNDYLKIKWHFFKEAGNYKENIKIEQISDKRIKFLLPKESKGKSIHLICEVSDNGIHHLSSYKRIIIHVN